MSPAQQIGSAQTYGKRYTAQNILGISTEADDDGNAASGNRAETGKRTPNPACPKCGTNAHVIKGREEYGGGWLCFSKLGGCGEKWHDAPAAPAENGEKKPESKAEFSASIRKGIELLLSEVKGSQHIDDLSAISNSINEAKLAKRLTVADLNALRSAYAAAQARCTGREPTEAT